MPFERILKIKFNTFIVPKCSFIYFLTIFGIFVGFPVLNNYKIRKQKINMIFIYITINLNEKFYRS